MHHVSLLATADGRWIPSDGAELLDLLGDSTPDFDPVGFVVRNLGFVQYDVFADNFAQITLFPKRVAMPALEAVQQRILSDTIRLFRLDYLDDETKRWTQQLAMSPREAIGRLNRLCGAFDAAAATGPYHMESLDLGAVMTDETHPAHALVRKWRSSFYRFDETVLPFIQRCGLSTEWMVISVDLKAREPRFRYIGEAYRLLYGDEFFLRGLGERVSDQPDQAYGSWVSPFYVEVAATWQPRLDRCTAEVKKSVLGRYDYERLILPWSTESDEIFLTLSSRLVDKDAGASSTDSTVRKKSAKSS